MSDYAELSIPFLFGTGLLSGLGSPAPLIYHPVSESPSKFYRQLSCGTWRSNCKVSKLNIVWLHKVLLGGFEAKPNFLIFLVASHNTPSVAEGVAKL